MTGRTTHRVPLRAAIGTLVGLTTIFAVSTVAVERPSSGIVAFYDHLVYYASYVLSVALVAWRAARARHGRLGWTLLALGMALWLAGSFTYSFVDSRRDPVPFPGASDLLFYSGYPALYLGLVVLGRSRVRTSLASHWLDGIVVGLAGAAVVADMFSGPVLAHVDGVGDGLFSAAYAVMDLMLVVVCLARLGLDGFRVGRSTLVTSVGFAVYAVGDLVFFWRQSVDAYVPGTPLDALWLTGLAIVAIGAWLPTDPTPTDGHGRRVAFLPAAAGVACVSVAAGCAIGLAPPGAALLALAGLLLAMLRLTLTVRELPRLYQGMASAQVDDLTGLGNRRRLREDLERSIEERSGGSTGEPTPFALAMIDLDGFKDVNDALGHEAGDELLAEVGERLRATAGSASLARLGGDEFAFIVEGPSSAARAEAGRVLGALRAPFSYGAMQLRIDASVGVCGWPEAGTPKELLRLADMAMYRAKRSGGGVAEFDPVLDHEGKGRLHLLNQLLEAVERGDLELRFQPICDLVTGEWRRCEALVRWNHPERGLIGPDQFLDLLGRTDLMHAMTLHVLDLAAAAVADWRRRGLDLGVSVNIAAGDVIDEALPDAVVEILARHGVAHRDVVLELTETALVPDAPQAERVVRRLAQVGVGMAIDDFGTGYSSLAQLLCFPVSELKVDRSLVSQIATDLRARAIVEAAVQVGSALGCSVTAEGLEDDLTAAVAMDLGFERGQGYLFGRPMSADELVAASTRSKAPSATGC